MGRAGRAKETLFSQLWPTPHCWQQFVYEPSHWALEEVMLPWETKGAMKSGKKPFTNCIAIKILICKYT